ncbi:phage holin family protein [Variovorax sp. J2P1-59]|uniref:phage holin family protein n=1 Tax=Variovorax flavidus TaxID=3053501 RepID=UPI002574C994|nr:phage holin family protein [Variovorax sp. J2P1-59]MDM0078501.1 phage holin family protein [Variovorax sp. J2P1-59]
MIHPLFKAALKRPDLLLDHLANYAELIKCEAADAGKGLVVQATAGVAAAVTLLLALGLTGFGVMLGVFHGTFHWVLVAVPGVAWVGVIVGAVMASRSSVRQDIKDVRDEVERDLQLLRVAKELKDE